MRYALGAEFPDSSPMSRDEPPDQPRTRWRFLYAYLMKPFFPDHCRVKTLTHVACTPRSVRLPRFLDLHSFQLTQHWQQSR